MQLRQTLDVLFAPDVGPRKEAVPPCAVRGANAIAGWVRTVNVDVRGVTQV